MAGYRLAWVILVDGIPDPGLRGTVRRDAPVDVRPAGDRVNVEVLFSMCSGIQDRLASFCLDELVVLQAPDKVGRGVPAFLIARAQAGQESYLLVALAAGVVGGLGIWLLSKFAPR